MSSGISRHRRRDTCVTAPPNGVAHSAHLSASSRTSWSKPAHSTTGPQRAGSQSGARSQPDRTTRPTLSTSSRNFASPSTPAPTAARVRPSGAAVTWATQGKHGWNNDRDTVRYQATARDRFVGATALADE